MEITLVLKRVFEKGKLCFLLPDDEILLHNLSKVISVCKEKYNDMVKLTFKPPYRKRSTGKGSQNHHLNGHIIQLCNETGHSYTEMKHYIKMKAVECFNYPYSVVGDYVVPMAESECNTEECSKLIECVHCIAAEQGIFLKEIE